MKNCTDGWRAHQAQLAKWVLVI